MIQQNSNNTAIRASRAAAGNISAAGNRLLGRLVFLAAIALAANSAMAERVLESIDHSSTPGGDVEIVLSMSGSGPDATAFATDEPPRIALDLAETVNDAGRERINVGAGPVRGVTAVEAGGRTRVVVELTSASSFTVDDQGDRVVLSVRQQRTGPATQEERAMGRRAEARVTGVDFRRGSAGEGRVVLDLSRREVGFDSEVIGREIRLRLYNASVDEQHIRKLDVTDFATPVSFINTYPSGDDALIVIQTDQPFEQLVYQTEDSLVLEVAVPAEEDLDSGLTIADRTYSGDPVTFNFQDIPVRAVLQFLADESDLNIVVSDSVTGSMTLRLINVPWDQALDIILDARGLDKRRNGNVLLVGPAREIADRERQAFEALQSQQRLSPLQTAYIQVNYANAGRMAELLRTAGAEDQGVLSSRGSVSVDERTNTLLVTDTADRIQGVESLVTRLDRPVKQVLIESRIVTANDDYSRELGARFGVTSSRLSDSGNLVSTSGSSRALDRMNNQAILNRLGGGPGTPSVVPGSPPEGIAGPPLNERLNVNLPTSSDPAGQFGLSILGSNFLVDLELSALEQERRGEVISSPRVITANQSEAFIRQGREIPYLEAAASGAATVSFKRAELELRVTPLITPDNRIVLQLNVKQDTQGEDVNVATGGTAPAIDTREISTEVLVNNGETVVLGGIFEQRIDERRTKVPFLGDVPGVGALFRSTEREDAKAELLIFITPRILNESLGR